MMMDVPLFAPISSVNVNIFLFIFFSLLHNVRAQLNQNQNTGDGGGLYPTQDPSSSPSVSNFAENNNDNNVIVTKNSINLALSPIENDLLTMNIKEGGEANYNIHELPNNDCKSFNILFSRLKRLVPLYILLSSFLFL